MLTTYNLSLEKNYSLLKMSIEQHLTIQLRNQSPITKNMIVLALSQGYRWNAHTCHVLKLFLFLEGSQECHGSDIYRGAL